MNNSPARKRFWHRLREYICPAPHEYEFHPGYLEILESPPSRWARGIAAGLTVTLLLALLWSIWGQMDIQAHATGQLLISDRSKVIQPLETAEVTRIHVRNGSIVKKNVALIELNPVNATSELNEVWEQYLFNLTEAARMSAMLTSSPVTNFIAPSMLSSEAAEEARLHLFATWQEKQARLASFDSELSLNLARQKANRTEINGLDALSKNIRARLNARKALVSKNIVSRDEFLESEKELLGNERAVRQKEEETNVLMAEVQKIEQQKADYLAQTKRDFFDQKKKANNEVKRLRQMIVRGNERIRQQILRSPVDGVVQQLEVNTTGGVVQPAQALMVIVPENMPQEAEVMVLNKDVGFVREGQSVEIKIDAFPYTRYGTLSGTVHHISRDSVKDEKLGLVFPVTLSLKESSMNVDGNPVSLQAGMSITADILTGKRRVIDYLLNPLREYRSEAMKER